MRKHVERAPQDIKSVITTYEGKHNHEVPEERGIASYSMNRTSLNSTNISNVTAPTPIRPLAVTNFPGSSSFTNSLLHDTKLSPRPGNQEPSPLDMLMSPGSFGYSAFVRPMGSYTNQELSSDAACSNTDKKKDDSFLHSLLSKNP